MRKDKKKNMTLAEHDALLKKEGRFEAVQQLHLQLERERQEKIALYRKAEHPFVKALNEAGFAVHSVWNLVNTRSQYTEALPILLAHLTNAYPERVREGIARALAVPEAHIGWPVLLNAFKKEKDVSTTGVKWALALALGATGTDQELEDVLKLLQDQNLGENRVPLLQVLARSSDPRAWQLLNELAKDPTIGKDARRTLRKARVDSQSIHDCA